MKIGIIGAGWYGCHLACVLTQHGHEVTLYEAGADILQRSSTLNQARLHAGYHYPRCYTTRSETALCFDRFCSTYPQFTREIKNNIYAVSSRNSMMDFMTYTHVMQAIGLKFSKVDARSFDLANVEGALATEERGLDFAAAKRYFHEKLKGILQLGHSVAAIREMGNHVEIDGKAYDIAINCTWCALNTYSGDQTLFFEPTTLFYYEATAPFYGALTTMDGACFSIYPYQDDVYTLSHVGLTPRGQFGSFAEANHINNSLTAAYIDDIRQRMEAEAMLEFPSFRDRFKFVGIQRSVKTKFVNARASRKTIVSRYGNVFTVLSGKIDTIFIAEDVILESLQALAKAEKRVKEMA